MPRHEADLEHSLGLRERMRGNRACDSLAVLPEPDLMPSVVHALVKPEQWHQPKDRTSSIRQTATRRSLA
jgi:hypothetical protein